jgi:hypothetical protein
VIVDIYQAIVAQMVAEFGGAPFNYTPANFSFGAEFLKFEGSPPRFVFVPDDEHPSGPVKGPYGAEAIGAPRALFGRNAPIEVHCWGADGGTTGDPITPYRNCEVMYQQISQVIHELLTPKSYESMGGRFEQIQTTNRFGRAFVAKFLWKLPMVNPTPTMVEVTEIQANLSSNGTFDGNPNVEMEIPAP